MEFFGSLTNKIMIIRKKKKGKASYKLSPRSSLAPNCDSVFLFISIQVKISLFPAIQIYLCPLFLLQTR